MNTKGAYVVHAAQGRVAAYGSGQCQMAMLRAKMEGGVVLWEREGFTRTADEIINRIINKEET